MYASKSRYEKEDYESRSMNSTRMTSPEPTDGSRSGSPPSPLPSSQMVGMAQDAADLKPRLSFSISRLLGDEDSAGERPRRPPSGGDGLHHHRGGGPSSPTSSSSLMSAVDMPALMAAQLSPLHLGANGTVIRVPAHRPSPMGTFPSAAFPWIGPAHPIVKDRLQGGCRTACHVAP